MSGSTASHDPSSPKRSIDQGEYKSSGPLVLSEEEIALFDPLTQAAARLMIKRGKAILTGGT